MRRGCSLRGLLPFDAGHQEAKLAFGRVRPALADDAAVEQLVWKQLRTCFDPEIPINVVDLGLVYEADVRALGEGRRAVDVKMTLTAPGCGMGDILVEDVRSKLEQIPTVEEADVELVFDPPWNQTMMSEAARLETGML